MTAIQNCKILELDHIVVYTDLICILVKADVAWCLFYSAAFKGGIPSTLFMKIRSCYNIVYCYHLESLQFAPLYVTK